MSARPSKMTKSFPKINQKIQETHVLYKRNGKKWNLPKESTCSEFWAVADAKIWGLCKYYLQGPEMWKKQPITKWKTADL